MERPAQQPAITTYFFQGLILLPPEENRNLARLLWRTITFKKKHPPFLKNKIERGT
jgi:hypothetical protein